jgi:hypothetical protein
MSKRFGITHGVRTVGRVGDAVGSGKPGVRTNTWAVLDSDSDDETVVPVTPAKKTVTRVVAAPKKMPRAPALPLPGPVDLMAGLEDFLRKDILWGDLLVDKAALAAAPARTPDPEPALRGSEEEFWAFAWTFKLHELSSDVYDTTELTDAEYTVMMTWLYEKGWWVGDYERSWVSFEPDNLPARRWCPPSDEAPRKVVSFGTSTCCGHKKEKKAAANAPILRFCRSTPCTEEGCLYVHDDTIPRVDRPCAFGERCGAADPTGLKRSQCLYMHPGETWSADLVIRRPAPSA